MNEMTRRSTRPRWAAGLSVTATLALMVVDVSAEPLHRGSKTKGSSVEATLFTHGSATYLARQIRAKGQVHNCTLEEVRFSEKGGVTWFCLKAVGAEYPVEGAAMATYSYWPHTGILEHNAAPTAHPPSDAIGKNLDPLGVLSAIERKRVATRTETHLADKRTDSAYRPGPPFEEMLSLLGQ